MLFALLASIRPGAVPCPDAPWLDCQGIRAIAEFRIRSGTDVHVVSVVDVGDHATPLRDMFTRLTDHEVSVVPVLSPAEGLAAARRMLAPERPARRRCRRGR